MIGYIQTQIQATYLESHICIARACKKMVYTAAANTLKCAGIWVTVAFSDLCAWLMSVDKR